MRESIKKIKGSSIAGTLFPELLHMHKRTVNYISVEKIPD
jgi:hypothetical protein